MRLTGINILGFRSHKETAIVGLKRVNWFLGKNATGKSSIIDAIAYAFTGRCRGTDRGGRGAEVLLSTFNGGKSSAQFAIGIQWEDGKFTRMGPGEGPASNAQKAITKQVGADPSLLEAVTDITHLLDGTPKEQEALLEQVLGISVSTETVLNALGEHGKALDGRAIRDVEDLARFETYAREQRVLAKRALESKGTGAVEVPATLPEFKTWTVEEAAENLKNVDNKLRGLYQDRGAQAAPSHPGQRHMLTKTAARLEAEVAALSKMERDIPDPTQEIEDVIKEMFRHEEIIETLKTAEAKGDQQADSMRLRLLKVDTEKCYLCHRKFTTGKSYQAIVDEASLKVESYEQGVLGSKEHHDALTKLRDRLARLNLARDKRKAANEEIRTKGAQLLEVKASLTTMEDEPAPVDTSEIDAKIRKGETIRAAIQNFITAKRQNEKAQAELEAARAEVVHWDAVVGILGPGGLRSRLVGERIGLFKDKANILLGALGLHVEFTADPFGIKVNGRPAAMLSETQRMKVGIGLQMTLSNMAGLRFVCIDRADAFDSENAAALIEILRKVRAFQFFICATADTAGFKFDKEEDWEVYNLSLDGEVSKLKVAT